MPRIAHIINPVNLSEGSDLFLAQPITFETIRIAHEFAKASVQVELLTTQFPEDHSIIPSFFRKLPDLQHSIQDFGTFRQEKKYPLIREILDTLYAGSDADYLIYTNTDIALLPQFYLAVNDFIAQGLDAFMINRRRISKKFRSVSDIPIMWSEVGLSHPGFDCFVFQRNLYPKFILGDVCIGVPFLEATLAHNLFAFSSRFRLFTDKHLTLHIGLEVMPTRDREYPDHNHAEFRKIYRQLKPHLTPAKLPYSSLPFYRKIIKWGLNPAVFIVPNLRIEATGWWNRFKVFLNEIRWRILAR